VRRLVLALVAGCVIVVAAVVVAVVVWPDAESESVDDVLAVLPADAEVVTFVDAWRCCRPMPRWSPSSTPPRPASDWVTAT